MDRFAVVRCSPCDQDIAVSLGVVRRLPRRWFSLYAARNGDFVVREVVVAGVLGFEIFLPATFAGICDRRVFAILRERLVSMLFSLGVFVVVDYTGAGLCFSELAVVSGSLCLPFLFDAALFRGARLVSKDLAACEVLVLSSSSSRAVTERFVFGVFPHVNHLSVFTERPLDFSDVSDFVFSEYGLPINFVSSLGSSFVRNADIVINLEGALFPNLFKRSAVYFDFVNDVREFRQRRPDLFVVNGFSFKCEDLFFDCFLLDAVLICAARDFGFDLYSEPCLSNFSRVQQFFAERSVKISSFVTMD